jgi:RNA polymerase sigma factor (sigma-70 family)
MAKFKFKPKAAEPVVTTWSVADLSALYLESRSTLISQARRMLRNEQDATEVVQEAFLKFILAAPELDSKERALAYIRTSINNLSLNVIRAKGNRPNLIPIDSDTSQARLAEIASENYIPADASISAAEDAAIIKLALSKLSPAERAALVMWEVEGRSTAEIAKELGIKESAVRHTVSRARASLRKVLSELVIDEARGLTALDLLSTTYKKATELAGKSSKIALTFILVLTAFLGLNSLTGNESNTTITTSSSQLSNDQDLPAALTPTEPVSEAVVPVIVNNAKSISVDEYADHMALSVAQLETVTLMLAVLDQTDGGPVPTE